MRLQILTAALIRVVTLGLLACLYLTPALAQSTAKGNRLGLNEAQRAMLACARNYCGHRSPSVTGARGLWVEGCFRQKMGKTPAQMGITQPRLSSCRALGRRIAGR
jgi:hypothetical protein